MESREAETGMPSKVNPSNPIEFLELDKFTVAFLALGLETLKGGPTKQLRVEHLVNYIQINKGLEAIKQLPRFKQKYLDDIISKCRVKGLNLEGFENDQNSDVETNLITRKRRGRLPGAKSKKGLFEKMENENNQMMKSFFERLNTVLFNFGVKIDTKIETAYLKNPREIRLSAKTKEETKVFAKKIRMDWKPRIYRSYVILKLTDKQISKFIEDLKFFGENKPDSTNIHKKERVKIQTGPNQIPDKSTSSSVEIDLGSGKTITIELMIKIKFT